MENAKKNLARTESKKLFIDCSENFDLDKLVELANTIPNIEVDPTTRSTLRTLFDVRTPVNFDEVDKSSDIAVLQYISLAIGYGSKAEEYFVTVYNKAYGTSLTVDDIDWS